MIASLHYIFPSDSFNGRLIEIINGKINGHFGLRMQANCAIKKGRKRDERAAKKKHFSKNVLSAGSSTGNNQKLGV